MGDSSTIRKSYKYRLYRNDKKDKRLRHKLFVALLIWNHMLALQKRYYRSFTFPQSGYKRKVSDLEFGQFMTIPKWVALKQGKVVIQIDRFTATTQVCSNCGNRHALTLRDRTLHCACGLVIGCAFTIVAALIG